jgi:putative DNA primase/helicase
MLAFVIARNRPRKFSKGYEKQHGLQNREYRIVVQSSSERALRDIARDAGIQRLGGEEVRFTDVPASEPGSQGIFDGNIKSTDGTALSEITKGWVKDNTTAARRYQGHVLPAFLDKLTKDKNWEATVRRYMKQFEAITQTKNLKTIYRIRSNFAIIWAAGALAIDYGVLPWKKSRLLKAVKKCFDRAVGALQKPEAVEAVGLAQSASDDPLETLKEKLGRCKLCAVTPRKKVSEQELRQRRSG